MGWSHTAPHAEWTTEEIDAELAGGRYTVFDGVHRILAVEKVNQMAPGSVVSIPVRLYEPLPPEKQSVASHRANTITGDNYFSLYFLPCTRYNSLEILYRYYRADIVAGQSPVCRQYRKALFAREHDG